MLVVCFVLPPGFIEAALYLLGKQKCSTVAPQILKVLVELLGHDNKEVSLTVEIHRNVLKLDSFGVLTSSHCIRQQKSNVSSLVLVAGCVLLLDVSLQTPL
jgi:hypothetical protein